MKTITLLLLICTAVSLTAQDLSPQQAKHYADLLVKKQILSEKGKRILLHELENKNLLVEHSSTIYDTTYSTASVSKQSILLFLTRAFGSGLLHRQFDKNNTLERKIRPEDKLITSHLYSTMILGMGGYQYQDCIHPKRSTIGSTRTRTLGDLYSTGLIDQRIYNEANKMLSWELVTNEYELLHYITARSVYYQFYEFNKNEQVNYINNLAKRGIIEKEIVPEVLRQYFDKLLLSIPEILEYSQRYIPIHLSESESKPLPTYQLIFEKIKTILPEFNYTDLQLEMIEHYEYEMTREDIHLTFSINGIKYSNNFIQNYRKKNDSLRTDPMLPVLNDDFYKGINQWLSEKKPDYRLFMIKYFNEEKNQYLVDKFGIILLKKSELDILSKRLLVSKDKFD